MTIQVVIPMAGEGTRFRKAGFSTDKPLLPVGNYRMFEIVVANVLSPAVSSVVLVSRQEWNLRSAVRDLASRIHCDIHLIEVESTTDGPASTVELAGPLIDPDLPLVTANSDQFVDAHIDGFYDEIQTGDSDGVILTMQTRDPKWSFARLDESGRVVEVREKVPISSHATVGIYGFKTGSSFFAGLSRMKERNDRTNGEFYIAPVYNHLIRDGLLVSVQDLGPVSRVMYGLGTPEDYTHFLSTEAAKAATDLAKEQFAC